MKTADILIQNKLGLHARAASKFVEVSKEYQSAVNVSSESAQANGKSIMNMMLLQASKGTTIKIETDGEDEQAALDALLDLVNDKFGEAE